MLSQATLASFYKENEECDSRPMSTRLNTAITDKEVASLAQIVDTAGQNRKSGLDLAKAVSLRIREKLTHLEIAERMGVSEATVQAGLKRFIKFVEDPGELAAYKENKSDLLESMEWKLLSFLHDRLAVGFNPRDNVKDIAQALKVVYELKRLESNQSTSNFSVLLTSIEAANKNPFTREAKDAGCVSSDSSLDSKKTEPLSTADPLETNPPSEPTTTPLSSGVIELEQNLYASEMP